MCNSDWGGVISCDFWQEDWYTKGDSERTAVKPESSGSGGSSGGSVSSGSGNRDWEGNLRIDAYDDSSIWQGYSINDRSETLTANKTYTLHARFMWGAHPGDVEFNVDPRLKLASDDAVAVSGVTISWSVDRDPDGAVASIVPSADTHTCAVTIDYSKLQTAPSRSEVAIKASITSALGDGLDSWGMNHPYYLGTGSYGYYFLLDASEDYIKNDTATVYLSK